MTRVVLNLKLFHYGLVVFKRFEERIALAWLLVFAYNGQQLINSMG